MSSNDRFQTIETDDGMSTLSIRATDLNDKGVYTARATNSVGELEAKTKLRIVTIKPMMMSDLQSTLKALKGESMSINLSVRGKPEPDVIWMRNNIELIPNDNIQITISSIEDVNKHILTILNVQPNDQGEYFAKISNIAGSIESKKCIVTAMSK